MKTRMTSLFYKSKISFIAITLFLILLPRISFGQTYGTASHNVTVIVNAITVISVTPTTVPTLTIPGGATAVVTAGVDQMTVTDNTTVLKWGTNQTLRKITIYTSLASPLYTLQVLATNIVATPGTAGLAAGQFTISTLAQDLITNLAQSSGHCTLVYTGVALASKGIGTDSHTLTLTITAQ